MGSYGCKKVEEIEDDLGSRIRLNANRNKGGKSVAGKVRVFIPLAS